MLALVRSFLLKKSSMVLSAFRIKNKILGIMFKIFHLCPFLTFRVSYFFLHSVHLCTQCQILIKMSTDGYCNICFIRLGAKAVCWQSIISYLRQELCFIYFYFLWYYMTKCVHNISERGPRNFNSLWWLLCQQFEQNAIGTQKREWLILLGKVWDEFTEEVISELDFENKVRFLQVEKLNE